MSVRAKFKCEAITEFENSKQAKLRAVYGTEGENADFTKYTPSGELSIMIDKEAQAAKEFVVGQHYYLTFEPAPAK